MEREKERIEGEWRLQERAAVKMYFKVNPPTPHTQFLGV